MKELLARNGNRRFFITVLLISATAGLMILDVRAEYVSLFGAAMSSALTFWFVQHSTKPKETP